MPKLPNSPMKQSHRKEKNMKTIVLDLTGCKYINEIHEKIRIAFDFPAWYGKNWCAFWDLLRSECDAQKVVIKGENTLPEEFAPETEKLHNALNRNIKFCKDLGLDSFSYKVIS